MKRLSAILLAFVMAMSLFTQSLTAVPIFNDEGEITAGGEYTPDAPEDSEPFDETTDDMFTELSDFELSSNTAVVYGIMSIADDSWLDDVEVSITVGGSSYEEGMYYVEGSDITAAFTWSIPEDVELIPGQPYTFNLGDGLKIEPGGGTFPGGTYEVDSNGNITFIFNDAFCSNDKREFGVILRGIVPLDGDRENEGEEMEYPIGGDIYVFRPIYQADAAYANKTMSRVEFNPDTGELISHAQIVITIDGKAHDLSIEDVLGDYLELADDPNFKITINGEEVSAEMIETDDGFKIVFDGDFHPGDEIVIEYDVRVTKEGADDLIANPLSDSGYDSLGNKASGSYKDVREEDKDIVETSDRVSINPPSLSKDYVRDGDIVTWTITINSGVFGDLLSGEVLDYIDLTYIVDTLKNLELTEDYDYLDLENLTLDMFDVVEEYDGSYTYTLTYDTVITGSGMIFGNTVEIKDHEELTTGVDVIEGVGLTKEFVEQTADDTMLWKITVEIPDIDYIEQVIIYDSASYSEKDWWEDYDHVVIDESFKINGVPVSQIPGVTVSGGTVTIDGDSDIIQNNRGNSITITVETDMLKDGVHDDGAFKGSFYYSNTANGKITLKDSEDEIPISKGSDRYTKSVMPMFDKSVVGGEIDWGAKDTYIWEGSSQVTWSVKITNNNTPFFGRGDNMIGTIYGDPDSDGGRLKLHLVDTLPSNMSFVEGSGGIKMIPESTWDSEYDLSDDTMAELVSALVITDNHDGTITIEWELSESMRTMIIDELGEWNVWSNYYLTITYDTKIVDYSKVQNGENTFVNTVEGEVNDTTGEPDDATVNFTIGKTLGKEFVYDESFEKSIDPFTGEIYEKSPHYSNGATANMYFVVNVNPQAFSFGIGGKITLYDKMGSSLSPMLESICIYRETAPDTYEALARNEYSVDYSKSTNEMTIVMPDGEHLFLTYWAMITDEPTDNGNGHYDAPKDATNTVEMYVNGSVVSENSSNPTVIVKPSAWSSYTTTFEVFKYYKDSDAGMIGLPDTDFELVPGTFDSSGEFVPETAIKLQSASNGRYTYKINNPNQIFRLTETKAPDGYIKDDTPYYFIFNTYIGNRNFPAGVTVDVITSGEVFYFENKPLPFAGLSVTKTVENSNGSELTEEQLEELKDTEFKLEVKLSDTTLSGTYGGMEFVKGVAEITIKHGETVTAERIPLPLNGTDVTYTVTETEANGYLAPNPVTGKLGDGKTAEISVVNTNIITEPASAQFVGKKEISGRSWNAGIDNGKYSFTLTAEDNAPMPDSAAATVDGQTITFGKITYVEAGVYKYTISETLAADAPGGVTKGSDVTVTVSVTEDTANHELNATVKYSAPQGGGFVFTNNYTVKSKTAAVPSITKNLTGRDMIAGEFSFSITLSANSKNKDGVTLPANVSVKGGSESETLTFGEITFAKPGEFTFVIAEEKGSKGGVKYDGHTVEVTYKVIDNLNGTLTVNSPVYDADELIFENTYTLTPKAAAAPELTKTISGRDLIDGEFEFAITLKESSAEDVVIPANAVNIGGKVKFDDIIFKKDGKFTFIIKEVEPEDTGLVTYDTHEIKVYYEVTDNGNGTLSVSRPVVTGNTEISNIYTPEAITHAAPAFTKTYINHSKLLGNDFRFEISTTDTTGNIILPDPSIVGNAADGSITFGDITFKATGEYVVIVKEVIPEDKDPHIRFDAEQFEIRYTVDHYSDGILYVAKEEILSGDYVFENEYTPDEIHDTLVVQKDLFGKRIHSGEFRFTISARTGDESTDVGGIKLERTETANGADGSVSFGNITFSKAGVYIVEIAEVNGGDYHYTYDSNVITVIYTVSLSDEGVLSYEREYLYGGKSRAELPHFINYFTPDKRSLTITKTVVGSVADMNEEFVFTVYLTYDSAIGSPGVFRYTGSKSGYLRNGGSITLKHGESITIHDIPVGTRYSVTEMTPDGYTCEAIGASGTFTYAANHTAEFVNVKENEVVVPSEAAYKKEEDESVN